MQSYSKARKWQSALHLLQPDGVDGPSSSRHANLGDSIAKEEGIRWNQISYQGFDPEMVVVRIIGQILLKYHYHTP